MATATESHLLTLAQWLSPAFPVGAFSYSHGLEWAVAAGDIADGDTLAEWIGDILATGSGRADAILLAEAMRAPDADALDQVDALARALAPSRERLAETVSLGAAFARTAGAIWPVPDTPRAYPVAVGGAAGALALPARQVLSLYLHSFAGNLVSAALRLMPLGQTRGQAILAALTPLCQDLAGDAAQATLDDIGSATFLADIASMRHATLEPRLFQS